MTETANFKGVGGSGPFSINITGNLIRYLSVNGMDRGQIVIDFASSEPKLVSTTITTRNLRIDTTYEYRSNVAGVVELWATETNTHIPANGAVPETSSPKDYGDAETYHLGNVAPALAGILVSLDIGPEFSALGEKVYHFLARPENSELHAATEAYAKELAGVPATHADRSGRDGEIDTARRGRTRSQEGT